MSGLTAVTYYDNYITTNYAKLKSEAQRICYNQNYFEDILQECLLKVREKIQKKGFKPTKYQTVDRSLYSFIWRAISNDFKKQKNKESRVNSLDYTADYLQNEIEQCLSGEDHDKELYYQQTETVTRYLFKYIEANYSEKHCSLYKMYYLTSASSYNKLAELTGYSFEYIEMILRKMKKDVKENLLDYIKKENEYGNNQGYGNTD